MTTDSAVQALAKLAMEMTPTEDEGHIAILQVYPHHKRPQLRATLHKLLDDIIDSVPEVAR